MRAPVVREFVGMKKAAAVATALISAYRQLYTMAYYDRKHEKSNACAICCGDRHQDNKKAAMHGCTAASD